MKRLMLIILLFVSAVAYPQTGSFAIYDNGVQVATKTVSLANPGAVDTNDIVDAAVTRNKLDEATVFFSGGMSCEPTYTDNGDNTITIDSCTVSLWDNADFEGLPRLCTMDVATLTLNVNATNYIVVNYNSGTPEFQVITDVSLITESDVVPVLTIYDSAGYLHTLNWDAMGVGLSNKLHQRLVKTNRYAYESGLTLTPTGLNFTLSSGVVWYGAKAQTLEAVVSTTDTVLRVAPNGTVASVTALDNTNYYSGNTLTTLTANRYAVNWVYRGVEDQKHVYIMLGSGDYTLTQAIEATPPAAPALVSSHAVLSAKVIIQKSATSVTSVQSAFTAAFTVVPAQTIPTTTKITSGTIAAGASTLVVPLATTLINGSAPKFQLVFDGLTHVYLNDPGNVGVGHGFSSVTSDGTNLTITLNYTSVSGGKYILYTLSDTY